MKKVVEKALELAKAEVGVRETGNNRGKRVEEYLRSAGLGPGNPWCAAFVYWCVDKAAEAVDVANPYVKTGYCPTIATWAREHDVLHERPEPGDIFLRFGTVAGVARFNHTGFVNEVNGADFGTIEGNTNVAGGREGIGVFERTRTNGSQYKFVRWGDVFEGTTAAKPYSLMLDGKKLADMPLSSGRSLAPVRKVAEALKHKVDWNNYAQAVLIDGVELPSQIVLIDGSAYAPIRDIAEVLGLKLEVDNTKRVVTIAK